MPELPEVEVLVRNLNLALRGKKIQGVNVRRRKILGQTTPGQLSRALKGSIFQSVARRGKYLVFNLKPAKGDKPRVVLGHLGMTGRMYLASLDSPLPKHAAITIDLGPENFVFEDTRYFGRFTLDTSPLALLGPEPLDRSFTIRALSEGLKRSGQPIKVKLLDQRLVAGIGNIYASEALFLARISPLARSNNLSLVQISRLHRAIRKVLLEAIRLGSTVPLTFASKESGNNLFYYGANDAGIGSYEERLRVYDREGKGCLNCGATIQRVYQAGRSTFYCETCQDSAI